MSRLERESRERGTASILAVLSLFAVAMSLVLLSLTTNSMSTQEIAETREGLSANYVAFAAMQDAMGEIVASTDGTGTRADGIGAMGIANPVVFNDASGNAVAEYKTYCLNKANDPVNDVPFYVMRVIVAMPSFTNPLTVQGFESLLNAEVSFALSPNAGALSISGPVYNIDLDNWDSGLEINGGSDAPAIVMSDAQAWDEVMDEIGDEFRSGNITTADVTGNPITTFDHTDFDSGSSLNDFDVSASLNPDVALNATQLDAYRDALFNYAEGLTGGTATTNNVDMSGPYTQIANDGSDYTTDAGVLVLHAMPAVHDGGGSGKPRLKSNIDFGSSEETVLIDTSMFYQGGSKMADNHDRKIKGKGTLIIMHPVGSRNDDSSGKMFDLDWEGDVFVLGYPDDRSSGVGENSATDNLIFLSRAQWDIKGNVVVVTRGQTEASVEMEGASSSDASKLKVEGSLLIFGDANTEESELDIEKWAHVEVKGILGMYGASVEIEVQNSSNTSLKVDGTFATGLSGTRTNDDFDFEATGDTTLKFDQGKVDDAVESLTELQSNLVFSVPIPDSVGLSAPASRSGVTLYTGFAADLASVEANSVPTGFTLLDGSTPADLTGVVNDQANGDYGIDLDLITENAP